MSSDNKEAVPYVPTRAELRSKLLSTKQLKKEEVEFFGTKIELRQSTFGDLLKAQSQEDRQSVIIEALLNQAYVPGTDERIFEVGDIETLKTLPFGADFLRVNAALERLTEVNFTGQKST